jgi:hypothetical protein
LVNSSYNSSNSSSSYKQISRENSFLEGPQTKIRATFSKKNQNCP